MLYIFRDINRTGHFRYRFGFGSSARAKRSIYYVTYFWFTFGLGSFGFDSNSKAKNQKNDSHLVPVRLFPIIHVNYRIIKMIWIKISYNLYYIGYSLIIYFKYFWILLIDI